MGDNFEKCAALRWEWLFGYAANIHCIKLKGKCRLENHSVCSFPHTLSVHERKSGLFGHTDSSVLTVWCDQLMCECEITI